MFFCKENLVDNAVILKRQARIYGCILLIMLTILKLTCKERREHKHEQRACLLHRKATKKSDSLEKNVKVLC